MSIAPESTVVLGNRFATELPELAVRWQAESTPGPRLLVLNEPLAAELGLDPDMAAKHRRDGPARRDPGAGGRRTGRPGLRRPSVRRMGPPPRRRPGAAARRTRRHQGPTARSAPQGVGSHSIRPRRRRSGGHRPDAARIRRQRSDARPPHPDHARPLRRRDRPPSATRNGARRCRPRQGRRKPPARRQLRIRLGRRRTRRSAPARRPRHRQALSRRRRRRQPVPRAARRGHRRVRPRSSRSGCSSGSSTG